MSPYVYPDILRGWTQDLIFDEVCLTYGCDRDYVFSKNSLREPYYVIIREVSMAMMRYYRCDGVYLSWAVIGSYFGKSHSQAIHGCRMFLDMWDSDKFFRAKVGRLFGYRRPDFRVRRSIV